MTVLLIDIGNTRIKWRFAEITPHRSASANIRWAGREQALALDDAESLAATWRTITDESLEAVFVSNVASAEREAVVVDAAARRWAGASVLRVRPQASQCGVANGYRDPAQLGPDRWMAMLGAHACRPDRTLLVCSFGTATTIDLLIDDDTAGRSASFVGGMILPGFDAMRLSLASSTARLPLAHGNAVDFADTTDDAIVSGIVAAQVGAVGVALRGARERLSARLETFPLLCLLAGGGADAVAPHVGQLNVDVERVHDLVLRGLAAVAVEHFVAARRAPDPALTASHR